MIEEGRYRRWNTGALAEIMELRARVAELEAENLGVLEAAGELCTTNDILEAKCRALAEKAAALDGLETALPISDGFSLFVAPGRGYEVRSALDGCELGSGPTLAAAIADALKESDTL
jgi:hypothetical protein